MAKPVSFDRESAARIANVVRTVERDPRGGVPDRAFGARGRGTPTKVALTGAGGIPARSGSTPGSATVTLQNFNGTSFVAGDAVTAKNWAGTAVGASRYILVHWIDGFWMVGSEDCP